MVYNLFDQRDGVLSSDYKSAGSNQIESLHFLAIAVQNTWETIYTVPADKTFYLTCIVIGCTEGAVRVTNLGTGVPASEVVFFTILHTTETIITNLSTPIKFAGGTRIAGFRTSAVDGNVCLIGWTE